MTQQTQKEFLAYTELLFRPCINIHLVEARQLTETDYYQMEGKVHTFNYLEQFVAGDWLLKAAKGERWLMPDEAFRAKFEKTPYQLIPDWNVYRQIGLWEASQVPEAADGFIYVTAEPLKTGDTRVTLVPSRGYILRKVGDNLNDELPQWVAMYAEDFEMQYRFTDEE